MKPGDIVLIRFPLVTVTPTVISARLGDIAPERLQRIRDRLAEWLQMSSRSA